MLMWTVTAVQILAILVCPLTCVSGHACCGADGLMAVAASCSAAVETPACDRCCCQQESNEEQHAPPAVPSEQNTCQGVCGGAVVEKPCELPAETNLLAVCNVVEDVSPFTHVELPHHESFVFIHGSVNCGRALRTLHASFLC